MTYEEARQVLFDKGVLPAEQVKGYWIFFFFQDRALTTLSYKGTLYEVNLVPASDPTIQTIVVNNDTCDTVAQAISMMTTILRDYENNNPIGINLYDEIYDVVLEELETDE